MKLLLLSVVLLVSVPLVHAQDSQPDGSLPQVSIPNTEMFSLSSDITGQDYQILVSLPEGYAANSANMRYPVVYLLDANYYFGAINDFIRVENLVRDLPNLIIVGIGYPEEPLVRRVEDMEENPDDFLDFVADELIPYVDARYGTRTTADGRTLAGHSLGGQFVLYTLFNRPELFRNYVAASPSWDDSMTAIEAAYASEHSSLPARLYMSASEPELAYIEPVFDTIQSREYEGLEATFQNFENATHGSSAIPAFTYGLRYVLQ
jgi:hypothetical protein